jgi:branched-subunit amino acid transport protein
VTWPAVLALALGTYMMKAAGPVALGSRQLPLRVQTVFTLLAVTLLGALIAISTFADGRHLTVDARAAGVAAAAVAISRRAPFVVVVIVAAAVAAVVRAIT